MHLTPEALVSFEPFFRSGLERLGAGRHSFRSTDDPSLHWINPFTQLSAHGIPLGARRLERDLRMETDAVEPLDAPEPVLDSPDRSAGRRMDEEEAATVRQLCQVIRRTLRSEGSLLMPVGDCLTEVR